MRPEDLVVAAAKIAGRWPDAVVRYSPVGRLAVYDRISEPGPSGVALYDVAPSAVLDPDGKLDVFASVVNHDEGDEVPD